MRILMAARDAPSGRRVEDMLQPHGFNVFTTDLGEEMVHLALKFDYDLILLNAFLSDMTGWRALRHLRERHIELPVLVLADPTGIEDVCRGFGFRGMHTLAEPFSESQLVACLRQLVPASRDPAPVVMEIGKLRVDRRTKAVEIEGMP